ncbi:MAG: indole-3-glycerol phosphate synthase TrpC, partial [Bacteroidales bacterium]|nr:indole-3-glycerol phosphate synthase TrpC [Bacteroidales bacterium]
MTILDEIVDYKKKEVADCKTIMPVAELENTDAFHRNPYSLSSFIKDPAKSGIIAEFKRQSPSKGIINDKVQVEDVTQGYARAGASALSVLTDFNFFGGSVDDLIKARAVNEVPILRKEFIIDEYQIVEAKSVGADAILLIAACLTVDETKQFAKFAR